ncbi:uncharacterized protein [Apostichopus japonicus]|uniref:uncharacterized protein isoform X2 n=1 Tax=Stichopus japonicus TaxID=307972 RepID=UPI003AB70780
MGDRTVNPHRLLVVTVATCVILLFLSGTVSSQGSNFFGYSYGEDISLSSLFADSVSISTSDFSNREPCVFRGELKLHNDKWHIGTCTMCICNNGTMDCDIISCVTAKCSNPVKIDGECCPLCHYRVFAETFDWELTGENPIPGQETPVSIDIDVTFRDDTRDLEGDDLWSVSLFGSSDPLGDGPRFGEVGQILNDVEGSTDITNGDPLDLDGIETEFEFGTIGCIDDVNYICMEFTKGDAPDPEFTLIVEGGRGDVSRDSLVVCKPQACQSRVVFTDLEATLISPDIIVENTDNTDTTVKLKATTDKLLTTTVAGEDLWQVKTFFSTNTNGRGIRVNEQPQILTAVQDDQTLNTGENLAFNEMDFQVDLSGLICDEVPFMCFELAKNPAASIDYTFETQPVQDPFVECVSMEDVCKGVVFTELEWSREIPEDHVPGIDSPIFIETSVDVEPYSREVTGVDLWQVSVFASRDMLGNERRDPIYSDVLTPIDAATTLPQGGPLTFPTLETPPFDVDKMGCGEFRYLCVEFQKGDNPIPDFTYETISGEDTIVKCHPEDCAGM